VDQREVAAEPTLHHVLASVEGPGLLALGHEGADAGRGEEGGNPRAAGPDPFGQRALGGQLDFDLSLEQLLLENGVLAT
jgi:hypothetical protein